MPRISGVPIPLSSRAAEPEGGKLAGIRMIQVGTPARSSTSQNGVPRRRSSTLPPLRGICQEPIRTIRPAASVREVDR